MSGGGGSNDGSNDMQVSGMEAAVSQEQGISTHADTKTGSTGGYEGSDAGFAANDNSYAGVTPSNVGINPNTGQIEQESNFYSGLNNEQQTEYNQAKAISQGTLEVDPETGETKPGRYTLNPNTNQFQRRDLSLSEHIKNAPSLIKWSPTLSFLWGAGANIAEWGKSYDWSYNPKSGTFTDSKGDNVSERQLMNAAAPSAPGLISGETPSGYSASQWYTNLGNTTGSNPFSFSTAFADAKAKQQAILGNPSAVRQLAVNESPFYNWLKENSLNKGIL